MRALFLAVGLLCLAGAAPAHACGFADPTCLGKLEAFIRGLKNLLMQQEKDTSCLPASVKEALIHIENRWGPVRITSTHRPGARVAGTGGRSFHADCRAVDFNVPPEKYKAAAAWLRANFKGGIGTYSCQKHHIHIDDGPPRRWHICAKKRHAGKKHATKKRAKSRKKSKAKKRRR